MMTVAQAREKLKDRRLSYVSDATGLHTNTLREIRDNPSANPSARTIEKLADYFMGVRE